MSEERQEIKIIGIDKDAIKTDPDKKEYWAVPFKLSSKPDQNWEQNFYEVKKKNANALRRKSKILENSIIVEVSSADDLQKILDVLKIEVVETNVLCEKDYQKRLEIRRELEALQKAQRDATQKFKDDADKLAF